MSGRRSVSVPSYRHHKQSGQGVVTLLDAVTRRRHDVLLGKYGTCESRTEYARVIAEWEAAGRCVMATKPAGPDLSVNELMLAFWPFVGEHYRRADGTPTNEVNEYRYTLKPLKALYGHTRAADFGPLALRAVRQTMIDSGLARPVVNKRVGRIRRMFRWAVERELVPPAVQHALQAVAGLQRGRTAAREPEPVRPVAEAHVEATLPHLPPPVAALVQLQLLTGARSGELVIMRTGDLNTTGRVWSYAPRQHKTAHRGREREIYIGPKAQSVLKPWLKLDLEAFVFSPAEAEAERNAKKREGRKTKLWPSHVRHKAKMARQAKRRRTLHDRYSPDSYARAITRACDLAFPPPAPLAQRDDETEAAWLARLTDEQKAELSAWRKAHRWHPHQLRHAAATRIRREFGIEQAKAVLGHSDLNTAAIYAEADRGRAMEAIGALG